MNRKHNRDVMNMASPKEVSMASMQTLSGLQDHRPEIALMGAAAVFLQLAEHVGIPAQEAFTATKNLINGDHGKRTEFLAIADYMKGEWS